MRSDLKRPVRLALLIAIAVPGVARAQAPAAARPAAPPQNSPGYPYVPGPAQPNNSGGQLVPQRSDQEAPKYRFRQPTDPAAGTKRPTVVEAASSTSASGKVQVETPATRQRVASPGQIEQLVQRSQGSIDFFELVDDIMDEIARQLAREDPNMVSPMAIKLIRLSPTCGRTRAASSTTA